MNIAVFASGAGTNAEAIIRFFNRPESSHRVSLVITDRAQAGVVMRAAKLGVDCEIISRAMLAYPERITPLLNRHGVEFIALAGFLALIPGWMVDAFKGHIVNIHPALLPRHGGKGMYGRRVHEAVVAAGDKESGITVHYVDSRYDSGNIIFQARVPVGAADSAVQVEQRVRELELAHYPAVIASLLD